MRRTRGADNTDFLKEWTFCVCVSLVCAVILSLFTPNGKMTGFYKILIAFFVFTSFVYPLKNLNADALSFDIKSINTELEEEYDKPYEDLVNSKVKEALDNVGIYGASVSSKIKVNAENGEIEILSVKIAVPDGCDKEYAAKTVFDTLGIKAEVRYIGE